MYINLHIKVYVPRLIEWPIVAIALWFRKKQYGYEFRRIKLTKGQYTIVDVEDYPKLAGDEWQFYESESKNFYAVRLDKNKLVKMHREIMNNPVGLFVDHKNGNGLDNRKKNLRIATPAQNNYNSRKRGGNVSSKYKGVSKIKKNNRWRAYITIAGPKQKHLGYFDNEIEAAKAYDGAAKELFGEFARLNFE
jgi:hypothetical protein